MNTAVYKIVLQTPLGPREGWLALNTTGTALQGTLQVMGHSNFFEGTCDAEGNCTFGGILHTLVRDIPYTAHGVVTAAAIQVKLQTDRSSFTLCGKEESKENH